MLTVKKCDDTTVISIQQNLPTVRALSYTEYRTPHLLNSSAILYLQYTQSVVIEILIHSYQHSDELRTVQCCVQGCTDVDCYPGCCSMNHNHNKGLSTECWAAFLSLPKPLPKVTLKVFRWEYLLFWQPTVSCSLVMIPSDGSYPSSHSILLTHSY